MHVMYSDIEEYFDQLQANQLLVFPRTEKNSLNRGIVRLTDFVEQKRHQVGYYLTYWVISSFRVYDEIHFIKIKIGLCDFWGKEFSDHDKKRQELITKTLACVQDLKQRIEKMNFDARPGQYTIPNEVTVAHWTG